MENTHLLTRVISTTVPWFKSWDWFNICYVIWMFYHDLISLEKNNQYFHFGGKNPYPKRVSMNFLSRSSQAKVQTWTPLLCILFESVALMALVCFVLFCFPKEPGFSSPLREVDVSAIVAWNYRGGIWIIQFNMLVHCPTPNQQLTQDGLSLQEQRRNSAEPFFVFPRPQSVTLGVKPHLIQTSTREAPVCPV